MPAKKEFSTAEEAAESIEFLRRRNRERAKEFMKIKLKPILKSMKYLKINVKYTVIIFTIKIKIYL